MDHTALPRPNQEHDKSRIPIFDTVSFSEDFFGTDLLQTQPVDGDMTPEKRENTVKPKEETTILDPIIVPESPGAFFLQFATDKAGNTNESENVAKKDSTVETHVGKDDELLNNVFSDTDEETQRRLGGDHDLLNDTSVQLNKAPALVDIKYDLLGYSPDLQPLPLKITPASQFPPGPQIKSTESTDRKLKRCGTNEHDSHPRNTLFSGSFDPADHLDLSKRRTIIPSRGDTEEVDFSQPPRCVSLFPPTQSGMSPMEQKPATPKEPPQKTSRSKEAEPKKKRARPSRATEIIIEPKNAPNDDALKGSPYPKGISLGEFRVDDKGTIVVDSTIGGATPIPVKKNARPKRMTKAQRAALEAAGRTPPLEVVCRPTGKGVTRNRAQTAIDDIAAPKQKSMKSKKRKRAMRMRILQKC